MTTITLDNPVIESKYSSYEIKMKFLSFLRTEIKEDKIELYQISVDDLPNNTRDRLNNIDSLNFVNY